MNCKNWLCNQRSDCNEYPSAEYVKDCKLRKAFNRIDRKIMEQKNEKLIGRYIASVWKGEKP